MISTQKKDPALVVDVIQALTLQIVTLALSIDRADAADHYLDAMHRLYTLPEGWIMPE